MPDSPPLPARPATRGRMRASAAAAAAAVEGGPRPGEASRTAAATAERPTPSIEIFRAHLTRTRLSDGRERIDAEGVIGAACFQDWLQSRGVGGMRGWPHGSDMDNPERVFQRTLTGCLTAADDRRPFDPDEEAAILKTIRVKRVWPAFESATLTIGCKGFRGHGYHEKRRLLGVVEPTRAVPAPGGRDGEATHRAVAAAESAATALEVGAEDAALVDGASVASA